MQKICIICGECFEGRTDGQICSKKCRMKRDSEKRRAARHAKQLRLDTDNEKMMKYLADNVPEAEAQLRGLLYIYGREAFNRAAKALSAYALFAGKR